MIKNFSTITFRNIGNQKVSSFINIFGLSIGMACAIIISLYIINELSYDKFYSNATSIYRIGIKGHMRGSEIRQAVTAAPMAEALTKEYDDILSATRLAKFGSWLVSYEDKRYNEENLVFTDSTFFDIFSFQLLEGEQDNLLNKPRTLVLTKSVARKYFGDAHAVGKKLKIEDDSTALYTVTGVIEDIPGNTHFEFNMLGSISSMKKIDHQSWVMHNLFTYILVKEGTNPDVLTRRINTLVDKYVYPEIRKVLGMEENMFSESENEFHYFLQPLTRIHLYSNLQYELSENNRAVYIYTFGVVAVMILIIACMNFINLTTASSTNRAREVMLRKVLGSNRKLLIAQFLIESVIFSFVSLLFALVISELLIPVFNSYLDLDLTLNLIGNLPVVAFIILGTIIIGLLAGIYPAVFISRFKPTRVLQGYLSKGVRTSKVRSVFVTLQFFVSILMITLTLIIFGQVRYMLNKDLGFYKDHVLVIQRPDALKDHLSEFKRELKKNKNVISTTNSNSIPGRPFNKNSFLIKGTPEKEPILFNEVYVNYDYKEAYGLELVAGRFFLPDIKYDSSDFSSECVINEKAVEVLETDKPLEVVLEQPWLYDDSIREYKIVGVVKDFHFQTVDKEIEPLVMTIMPGNLGGYINVHIKPGDKETTMSYIENVWNKYAPAYPFQYFNLREEYNMNYESIVVTGRIFLIFSLLAVFVGCLGLFGLVTFTANLRTREIGLRKALGATVTRILTLFIKESLTLILYSTIFAWLAAWFIARWWLEGFHFHLSIRPEYFIISTCIVSVIAIITVSVQAFKAARLNPGEALKYE